MSDGPQKNPDESFVAQLAVYSFVLGQFLGGTGAGVGLGWVLWKHAGFPWWILILTSGAGIYAASQMVIRYQRRLEARAETASKRGNPGA